MPWKVHSPYWRFRTLKKFGSSSSPVRFLPVRPGRKSWFQASKPVFLSVVKEKLMVSSDAHLWPVMKVPEYGSALPEEAINSVPSVSLVITLIVAARVFAR